MDSKHFLQPLRAVIENLASRRRLPLIEWDREGSGPATRKWPATRTRRAIDGNELLAECWLSARESGLETLVPSEEDIERIAWRLSQEERPRRAEFNVDQGYLETIALSKDRVHQEDESGSDATSRSLTDLMATLQRTRSLIRDEDLTEGQIAALLAPDFVVRTAASRGISRAAACRLRKRAERNVRRLERIDAFLFGDWRKWLHVEAATWKAPWVRGEIWPLIKPGKANGEVRSLLRSRQAELFDHGIRLLNKQVSRHSADPDDIARGYHACIIATYIDPSVARDFVADMRREIDRGGLLYRKITERCAHLCCDPENRREYLETLGGYLERPSDEGRFFATYAAIYFGAASDSVTRGFLAGSLSSNLELSDPDAVIQESWENLSDPLYRDCTILDDINFARCVVVMRNTNIMGGLRRRKSLHFLGQLARHSRKSRVPWIAKLADSVLPLAKV